MTFSLQKSVATDLQAANKQAVLVDVNDDSTANSDTELNAPESVFSKLLSLFNSTDENSSKVGAEASNSKASMTGDKLNSEPGDESGFAADNEVESSDEFLTRLGQSSMLLQDNSNSGLTDGGNGNKLPLQSEQTNLASSNDDATDGLDSSSLNSSSLDNKSDISILDNNPNNAVLGNKTILGNKAMASGAVATKQDAELANQSLDNVTDSALEDVNGQQVQTSIQLNNSDPASLAPAAAVMASVTGIADNDVSVSDDELDVNDFTSKSGLLNHDKPTADSQTKVANSLNKNSPFGQANRLTTSLSGNEGITAENNLNSTTEILSTSSSEPIEQLDFAQIMEAARKPETLEQTTRTMAKAVILTEAEQQILDKRVNINNQTASSELNEKIAIMAGKELQTATIRLDPAELGSMNIKLVVQNDQLNVIIQAQNSQSRDLLEQQMPRLREMLQQQGMTLGETQVQADGGQQQSAFQQSQQQSGQKNSNNEANYALEPQTEAPVTTQYWQDSAKGVDFYA